MGRRNEPWYWEARRKWYIKIDGKRHCLGPDEDEAQRKFHAIKAKTPAEIEQARKLESITEDSVASILDDFLTWTQENRAEQTYKGYRWFCESFCKYHPALTVAELTALHVTVWLNAAETWGSTTKKDAITALNRGLNWAVKNRGLDRNPIHGMEKPRANVRTETITPEEFQEILKHTRDQEFRDLLIASWDVGARPQETKGLEARHVDTEKCRAVLLTQESKGKKTPRVMYFPTERTMEIIRRLVVKHPEGKIFRNTRGNPWTGFAVKCRFAKLEQKIGKRFNQYMFRHTWITRKLIGGVDSHIVAKLSGHQDTGMIDRVYSHAADDYEYMLEQAKKEKDA